MCMALWDWNWTIACTIAQWDWTWVISQEIFVNVIVVDLTFKQTSEECIVQLGL